MKINHAALPHRRDVDVEVNLDVGLGNAPQEQNRATIKGKTVPGGGRSLGGGTHLFTFFLLVFFCCENECGNFSAIILSDVN